MRSEKPSPQGTQTSPAGAAAESAWIALYRESARRARQTQPMPAFLRPR